MTQPFPDRTAIRTLCLSVAAALALAPAAAPAQLTGRAQRDTTPTAAVPVTTPAPPARLSPAYADTMILPAASGPLLDAPVSRTGYRLGPGDRLEISVFGEFNQLYAASVGPEGTVVLPGLGITRVLGLNLDQAEQRVRETATRYLRNVDVRLTLTRVRSFKVYVVGNVPQAGVRSANAATRVSEVVGPVGGTGDRRVGGRNITLRRNTGETLSVDLIRFLLTGDVSANPTLREGDAVVVPTFAEGVHVLGTVRYPGEYEFRPNETLAELLDIANGGTGFPPDVADTVRVVRFTGPQTRAEIVFSRDEAVGARGRAFVLSPFDGIFVPGVANYKVQSTAEIAGQVAHPGFYPIRPDTTTVRELVMLAGGFTPQASLADATLRRPPPERRRDELADVPAELLSTQERRVVQVRNNADATVVVLDFTRLNDPASPAYWQTLRANDLVTVPVRRGEVSVLGAVRNPGQIAYDAGSDVRQYLAAAGGLTQRADWRHAVVLRARTGARLELREVRAVEPGDALIVPFRDERTTTEVLQLVATITSTITGAILAAVALLK